jgi:hypothetical protein
LVLIDSGFYPFGNAPCINAWGRGIVLSSPLTFPSQFVDPALRLWQSVDPASGCFWPPPTQEGRLSPPMKSLPSSTTPPRKPRPQPQKSLTADGSRFGYCCRRGAGLRSDQRSRPSRYSLQEVPRGYGPGMVSPPAWRPGEFEAALFWSREVPNRGCALRCLIAAAYRWPSPKRCSPRQLH